MVLAAGNTAARAETSKDTGRKRAPIRVAPHHAASSGSGVSSATSHSAVPRPAAFRAPRKAGPLMAGKAEEITVSSGVTPNGVSGHSAGGGMMPRQTEPFAKSGVTRDYIAAQAPATNALTLVRNVPGVVVASADPAGATDRMSVSIRGMNQNELGYELEGMNPSDVLYYSPTSSGWADTENIGSVMVTPGAPDLMAPTFSAVGGLVSETLRDPSHKFGGLLDLTYGGNNMRREFIRLESGELGHSGIRSFASFSDTQASNWRGPGDLHRWHVDFKAAKKWGDGNSISAFMSYNDVRESLYTYPTMAQWNAYGIDYNYRKDFTGNNTNYYKFHQYEWKHARASVQMKFKLADGLNLSVTPYIFDVDGTVQGGSTLNRNKAFLGSESASPLQFPEGSPSVQVAQSNDTFRESTFGINSVLDWKKGHNDLQFGYWYSYINYAEDPTYSLPDASGDASRWGQHPVLTASGAPLKQWDAHVIQQTNTLSLMDTYSLLHERLKISAGFKEAMITRTATNLMPGATYATGFSDAQPLPRVAISYQVTPRDQIYLNGTTAFREAAAITPSVDMFSAATGQMTSRHVSGGIKPEYSIAEELGYRHYGRYFNISLSLFNYNFTNRQITSSSLVEGTTITTSLNGGGQTTRGISGEISLPRWHHFTPYFSGQYLHATTDNNLASGSTFLPTAGKVAVLSPKFSGSIGLSYDDGHVFGNFAFNYVGSEYSTFMNDEKIPSYETANLGIGYRFNDVFFLKRPQIQLNMTNLGNSHYLSGAWGLTTNARNTLGTDGHTVIKGSAPTYITGGNFTGLVSFTTGF
ncbi:TonB-dependent receptor plug domain-containing protein [Acetobacter farinalis]|nr:TonB-dependent receptor [Acetobacter farinalis]NHO30201.1 TonB-dependent receptor plug domain-containing protein [Acetobacter farinalis]